MQKGRVPKPRLAAIILAAGRGGRMGRPKLNLELDGVPFLSLIVRRLWKAGIRDIAVVVRRSQKTRIPLAGQIRTVVNYRPGLGMFSSVQCGLRAMKGFCGYLICPVDHPGIMDKTYSSLKERYLKRTASVIRPVYRGKPGHPLIFSDSIAAMLLDASPSSRMDYEIKKIKPALLDIKVMDENILININTYKELTFAREYNRQHTRCRSR